ncbi:ABC transporter substrate-binding protein [Mucilaginibacter calamicampi]|uniref:ABC transporter substrate-binding protein n=1 Tax=Mucilaginibacter calamicampi TaxID=1302352 RepID=A0ABW2YVS8_9SPHI
MNRLSDYLYVFMLCVALSSCRSNDEKHTKTVFNLNLDEGLTSLDPAFCRNRNTIWMDNQLYNGLVQLDDSLQTIPAIAKNWETSADGSIYTFHLRNDVFFHDDAHFRGGKGRKVTAADFTYSFSRLIDPKVASSGSWIFSDKVTGKEAFEAVNDSTFRITLKQPFAPFLSMLTAQYCSVVPHEVVEFYGKDFRSHPVGTGPFRFKYWKEGETLVLLKNEQYWERDASGKHLPYLDAVQAGFIDDKQTSFLEFLKKKLDFLNDIDGSYRDDILTKTGNITKKYEDKFQLSTGPFLNTVYLGMLVDTNLAIVKNSPLRKLKVRQAINCAIDKRNLIKYLRNGLASPGQAGFIPTGMPGFDAQKAHGYNYNPAKCRRLLAEAGYPNGKNMPVITLNSTVAYHNLIEYVQGELDRVGIKTNVEVVHGASLREMIAKNGINFFYGNWIADYPDGENYLSVFYSKNKIPFGPNYTGFNNRNLDRLYESSYHIKDDAQRHAVYRQMDNLIMDQAPVVVLYYDKRVNLYQNNISGYSANAQNQLTLKRIKKIN